MATIRKKQVRFTSGMDIMLLREVVAINPFTERVKDGWIEISRNVSCPGFEIDARRARERCTRLCTFYKQEDAVSLRKSGTEEEYTEKDELLHEIVQLEREAESQAEKTKRKDDQKKRSEAENLRKRAMETLTLPEDEDDFGEHVNVPATQSPSTSKKRCRNSSANPILDYLQQKHEVDANKQKRELDVKEGELKLAAERLQLERERLQMERHDREARLAMDREEKMAFLNILLKK